MAGYIGSKSSVTQVDGYNKAEADAEFLNDPAGVITVAGPNVGIGESSPDTSLDVVGGSADSVVDTLTLKNDSTGSSAGTGINFVVDGVNDVTAAAIYGQRVASAYHQGSLQFLTRDSAGEGLLERMRLDGDGNVLVGQTTANAAVVGASIRSDGEIVATCSGAASGSFNRLGEGATVDIKKDGAIVGSLASDVLDFLVIGQNETGLGFVHDAVDVGNPRIIPRRVGSAASSNGLVDLGDTGSKFKDLHLSGDVYLGGREQFNLKNHGDIGVGGDYNTISLANSVLYQNGAPTNNAHSNNGLALYLSSYGMGGSHDDATSERAVQIYAGDTSGSGLQFRVRQGTSGWHRWKNLQSDWAALSGPTSYYGAFESNWSAASGNGESMSASTSNRGITIAESGYYQCQAWQRSTGTDFYIGIALSGSRPALETRSDGVWGHDHAGYTGSWSHSTYTGYLNAGEKVTSGASSSTGGTYQSSGYAGGLLIVRLS